MEVGDERIKNRSKELFVCIEFPYSMEAKAGEKLEAVDFIQRACQGFLKRLY